MGPISRSDNSGEPWDAAVTAGGPGETAEASTPRYSGILQAVEVSSRKVKESKHQDIVSQTSGGLHQRDRNTRRSVGIKAGANGEDPPEHVLGIGGPVGDTSVIARKISAESVKRNGASRKMMSSRGASTRTSTDMQRTSPREADEQAPGDQAAAEHRQFLESLGSRWVTVEPLIVAYMVAYMALLPVLQQYTYTRLAVHYNITEEGSNKSHHEQCRDMADSTDGSDKEFQESISLYNTLLVVMGGVPALVVTVPLGSLSDRLGRRMGMIPQLAAGAASGLAIAVAIGLDLPLWVLPVVQFLVGLSGSMPVFMATAFSYLADTNPPEQRYMRILIIELATGLGSFVGQSVIGWLIDVSGFVVPCVLFTIILTAALLYCIFVVPETVRRTPKARLCTCEPFSSLVFLWLRDDGKGRRVVIWISFFIMFTYSLTVDALVLIQSFYLLDPPLCWSPTLIGIFNGAVFVLKALGSLGLMKLLFGRVPASVLQIVGLVSVALFNVAMGLSGENWVPFLAAVLGCGTSLLAPVTRSIASGYVPDNQQGALFSGLAWAQMLSLLLRSPVVNLVYAQTPVSQHGLIYILGSTVLAVPLALVGCLLGLQTSRTPGTQSTIDGVPVHDTQGLVPLE